MAITIVPSEIHAALIEEFESELQALQREHDLYLDSFHTAKMMELAAGDDKDDILTDDEKATLQEFDRRVSEYVEREEFWVKRLEKLKNYDHRLFGEKILAFHKTKKTVYDLLSSSTENPG